MKSASLVRIIGVAIVVIALVVLRLALGHTLGWPDDRIIWRLRLTSAAAALVVGICLAQSGVYLQTLLRNPLASPYILGLATGAGVGVAIVQVIAGMNAVSSPWWLENSAALLGALGVVALVYSLGRRRGWIDPTMLLLVGVMISVIAGALLMGLQFTLGRDADQLIRWMMGRIAPETSPPALITAAIIAALGLTFGLLRGRALDVATLSDDEAMTSGLNLPALRAQLFIVASALAATSVVLAGPIGFVGLVAPHLARLIAGPSHRAWIIMSSLLGAALLLGADSAVQLIPHLPFIPQPRGLWPVGMLTSLIGGPVFLILLRRQAHLQSGQWNP